MQRVAVVGGVNKDVLALLDEQPRVGHASTAADWHDGLGGKGANQAVAAARLGARVELVGRVGHDAAGRAALRSLRAEDVGVARVVSDPRRPTGRVVGMVQRGVESATAARPGANGRLSADDVDDAAEAIAGADVLLCQLEVPLEAVRRAVELAREHAAFVAVDPSPPAPGVVDLLPLADMVRVNADEAHELTGVRPHDEASAREAAEALRELGTRYVSVSAGAAGDALVWETGHGWVPAPEVDVVDPTGAGDALHAVLALRLAAGARPAEALRLAAAVAGLTMTALGAQSAMPSIEEARRLAEEQRER
jgi:ribokinase